MTGNLTAIIHIGLPKTGTTAIQRTLSENKARLLEEGIYYRTYKDTIKSRDVPAACLDFNVHDPFLRNKGIDTLSARKQFREGFRTQLASEMLNIPSDVHTVVLSDENFYIDLRDERSIENIKHWLSEYVAEFHIVCYLRRQIDKMVSAYSTKLKLGNAQEFERHLANLSPGNHRYNYANAVNKWASVFGRDAIDVRIADQSRLNGAGIVDDFLYLIGVSPDVISQRDRKANESLNHLGQRLMLELNTAFKGTKGSDVRDKVDNARRMISRDFAGKGQQPDAAHAQALQAQFNESNEEIRSRWLPSHENLFSQDFSGDTKRMLTRKQERTLESVFALIRAHRLADDSIARGDLDAYVDTLRETAKSIEESQPRRAVKLYKLARQIRPNSPQVKKRLDFLEKRLGTESGD